MNGIVLIFLVLQLLLMGSSMLMGTWVKLPSIGFIALGLLNGSLIGAQFASVKWGERIWKWALVPVVFFSVLLLAGTWVVRNDLFLVDTYYAAFAWLLAGSIFLAGNRAPVGSVRVGWKFLGMAWTYLGVFIWIAVCYAQNRSASFHVGLLLAVTLLIVSKFMFRMPAAVILTANTLILLLIGLPVVDWITRPGYRMELNPDLAKKCYTYEAARKDPVAFGRWWKFYLQQWMRTGNDTTSPDPTGKFPMLLLPNTHSLFFENEIRINSLGFRGAEVRPDKGNAYRIVALGESTTFGSMMKRDEKTWPEWLEEMIRTRLKPDRPVEVINAGVPRYHLRHNLLRLGPQILPLKPDMIISYHGANGFEMLHSAVPLRKVELPPAYQPRPLKLLADSEYRLKMIWYSRHPRKTPIPDLSLSEAMQTDYAHAYEELFQVTHTNGIRLVLANYSMAVNSQSERGVIEFYRGGFPMVDWWIKANEAHSMIVAQMAAEHKEICFVDTHPHLDGEHDKFVDVMHFTGDVNPQMAETMFEGIKDVLAKDLSTPKDQ